MGVEERLSLDAVGAHTLIAAEHRHRYRFAAPAAAGRRVLDLCCGAGYGTHLLAAVAASVVGVDRDAAAVDTAQAHSSAENVRFVAADALNHLRALEPSEVDLIVCFEGLEHLPAVEEVFAQLARLVEGGVGLIASVPNSLTFEEANEYHLTDFDLPTLRRLVAGLPGATIAYQNHAEGSLIRGEAVRPVQVVLEADGELELDWANHFVVLAGVDTNALLDPGSSLMHLAVAPVNHCHMRNLERANRELHAVNARLSREHLGLGAAGAASAVLRADARRGGTEHDAQLAALEQELSVLRAERAEYRRAWVAVHSSRLTNLAARLAGHRFER